MKLNKTKTHSLKQFIQDIKINDSKKLFNSSYKDQSFKKNYKGFILQKDLFIKNIFAKHFNGISSSIMKYGNQIMNTLPKKSENRKKNEFQEIYLYLKFNSQTQDCYEK